MTETSGNQLRTSWTLLMRLSAALAEGNLERVSVLLKTAHRRRVPARTIYESILQSYLFLGYPRCIEGLKLLRIHYPRFTPPPAEVSDGKSMREWRSKGERLCRKIYGANYGPLRSRIGEISPDLDQWMVWEGYGKVLSRDGLPPLLRELCTCSALIVTGDTTQLHSHVRGALNSGGTPNILTGMLSVLRGYVPKQRFGLAQRLVRDICQKAGACAKKV